MHLFTIEYISSEELWQADCAGSSFESWNWKRVQEAAGRTVEAVRVLNEQGNCVAKTLFVCLEGPFHTSIVLSPRGPVFAESVQIDAEVCTAIMERLTIEMTQKYRTALSWRFEPSVWHERFPGQRVKDVQSAWSRVLDLPGATEESLLSSMKQKTRYNIRLAEKKGVVVNHLFRDEVSIEQWSAAIDQWIALQDATAQRHGISHHGAAYYQALLNADWNDQFVSLIEARFDDQVIAMLVLLSDQENKTVTYLFGASSDQYTNVMAPYALQWKAIRYALTGGFTVYDFYGIAPEAAESGHSLSSVTRFKNGFGGRIVEYPGTFDFPIRPIWYRIYRLVKHFR